MQLANILNKKIDSQYLDRGYLTLFYKDKINVKKYVMTDINHIHTRQI